MANRFLNNIKINDSYTLPAADGTADQVITTNGSGQLSFVDQSTLAVDSAEAVVQTIKCNEALTKGDPVYIVGFQPGQNANIVAKADASNPAKMPATGVADEDYASQGFGTMTAFGSFNGDFDTTGGTENWSIGDILYVKPGGGLTNIKPTGTNLIQNIAIVSRVQSETGEIEVIALGRTNDIPNLTQGKIWVGSTGNTIESTVVHLDESNGRMGIGTTNPSKKLTLEGGGFSMFADGGTSADAFSVTTHNYAFADENEDAVYSYNGTDGHVFSTGGSTRVNIKQNGNVGIGVTNPSEKLEVSGKILATGGQVRAGSYLESFPSFSFANDTDTGMFSDTADQLEFATGGSSRVTINSSGNVGVGTTDPSAKVHASDGGTVPSIDAGTMLLASNTSATGDYSSMSIMSGTAGIASLFFGDTDAEKRGSVRYLNSTDEMRFRTANTDRVTIKSGGNVGIGTTDPGQKLDVAGYIAANRFTDRDNASFYLEPGSGATGQWKVQTPSGYVSIGPNNTSWAHFYTDRSNGYYFDKRIVADTGIFGSYNEDLTLQAPYNTTRMTINSSTGNVGINTTNPGYHLDVDGEARVGSTNRTSTRLLIQAENTAGSPAAATEIRMLGYESRAQGIFFQDSANSGEEWFAGLNYAASWDKYSIGYDASGGQGEYVDNAILTVKGTVARVGVKNHDPQADMDVNGTIRAVGGTFTSGTSGADSNASAGIVLRRGKKLFSGIPNSGNQDFYLRSLLEQTTSGEIIIGQGGTGLITDISLKPGTSGNIKFFGSGSEDMRIDSVGDLQIGTSYNPAGYKVNINGDIGASTGSQLYMYQDGGTGSTNAVIRVVNLDTSNYGQSTPNIYSDSGNYYGNRHCEFATNGTVRGWIGHNGSTTVTYSTTSSDERLKKNIEAWDEDTLNKFRNIQPKKFNFIDQEDTDSKERGYIAQNMVDSFPEAYPHDFSISQTEGMYSFNPSGMVVYLMKAVKDLIAENDNLKARVEALENA